RLMYTIIIFGLTLWLIPKEFTVAFNAYTEIPWLFQIIVFAFSFVVAISFSRLRAHIQKHYSLLPEQRVLLRLSEKEIAVFKDFLKTGNLIITSPCRNPVMKKLERKCGSDSNLLIVFYVQIMPDDLVMHLHRF